MRKDHPVRPIAALVVNVHNALVTVHSGKQVADFNDDEALSGIDSGHPFLILLTLTMSHFNFSFSHRRTVFETLRCRVKHENDFCSRPALLFIDARGQRPRSKSHVERAVGFSADPQAGAAPLSVRFRSVAPQGNDLGHIVDFGDGTNGVFLRSFRHVLVATHRVLCRTGMNPAAAIPLPF